MKDGYGREINYMRISITDRCNLRCQYCMPDGIRFLPEENLLTFDELLGICKEAVNCGITRFKITGGEPMVRRDWDVFARSLKLLPGVEQVTLTTNGVLLQEQLERIVAAGIDAVNISLDTLDRQVYADITGFDVFSRVLDGILALERVGIPVKVNAVLQEGINGDAWRELILLAQNRSIDVRFIELMPIGEGSGLVSRGVSNEVLKQMIAEELKKHGNHPQKDERQHGNGPAVYIKPAGFCGGIGFISAMHGKYCGRCNRIRLTSAGELKPCLCFAESVSLAGAARSGNWQRVRECIGEAIAKKPECHVFDNAPDVTESRKMVQIGG